MLSTIQVIHFVPGRVRIQFAEHEESGAKIEMLLRLFPEIYSAVYSEVTQTAVVHYSGELRRTWLNELALSVSFVEKPETTFDSIRKNPKVRDLKLVALALIVEKAFALNTPVGWMAILRPPALATLYASREIMWNGIKSVFRPNEDTLTTSALTASLLTGSPSSAIIIYTMSTISELLNEYTINQTRGFVRDMMQVDTKYAWKITENGSELKIPVEQIHEGDKVMIFQGEKVPFDGESIAHVAEVDQSAITGEYESAKVKPGSFVYAGSVVVEGKFALQVERVGEDLTVNRMIRLIEGAQDKQATIQTSSERFTKRVVPISFMLAGLIFFVTRDWSRVLNMLVIDYVCGVQLSTATAISATIGKSAQQGVLVKGGQTLEQLSQMDTIVLDKTGTITEGTPAVTKIATMNGYSEKEVLEYAASVEEHSSHPIAYAILNEAKNRGFSPLPHHDETLENYVGKGVLVEIDNEKVLAGSRVFMEEYGITVPNIIEPGMIYIGKGNELMGMIVTEDKIRPGMKELIQDLKKLGLKEAIMLTGDQEASAERIAREIGIDRYIADAMPQDKADFVHDLKNEKRTIMMVGDGINDAPALAFADVGVTMGGKKTDIAMETADMVIHSDNPQLISESVEFSKTAMRVIRQNIVTTLIINTGAIVLGTFGVIRPVVGAAVHNAATIGVVLNSAKLLIQKGEKKHGISIQNHPRDSRTNSLGNPDPKIHA